MPVGARATDFGTWSRSNESLCLRASAGMILVHGLSDKACHDLRA